MAREQGRRRKSSVVRGTSRPLDLDRLLGGRAAAVQAAELAEAAATAGELVRRLRVERGISQAVLADRVGSTQAHISELERGLGPNGPTVATLDRILHELGDALVVDTRNERARRAAEAIAIAAASVGGIGAKLDPAAGGAGLSAVVGEWAKLQAMSLENPYAQLLVEGMLTGLRVALSWMGGMTPQEIRSVRAAVEKPLAQSGGLPARLTGGARRG